MGWCAPTCDDPEGLNCLADANAAIDNFDQVKDQLTIPGCVCREGFIKLTDEPFSPCVPKPQCIQESPVCPPNSVWSWEAPACFSSCQNPQSWATDDPCQVPKIKFAYFLTAPDRFRLYFAPRLFFIEKLLFCVVYFQS